MHSNEWMIGKNGNLQTVTHMPIFLLAYLSYWKIDPMFVSWDAFFIVIAANPF